MENQIPEGTILVVREGWVKKLFYIEDLMYTNNMEIGHVFNTVRRHYGKTVKDYGPKWIKFLNHKYEVSRAFLLMKAEIDKCESDFDKLQLVCKHLGEDPIEAIPVE